MSRGGPVASVLRLLLQANVVVNEIARPSSHGDGSRPKVEDIAEESRMNGFAN
jgi:hypothetical protein